MRSTLLITSVLLIFQISLVLSHAHIRSAHELHLYRRRYELQHRQFISKCNDKIRARQLKRALSPASSLHPARQSSLLQELSIRADNSSSSTSNTSSSCVLDGEVTQGPYHVLGELVRQNITEGQGGIPVTFDVDFVDYTTCEPLKNAWVDIWHANSTGYYSGYTASTASGTGSGSTSGMGSGSVANSSSSIPSAAIASNGTQSISAMTMSAPSLSNSTSSLSVTIAAPTQSSTAGTGQNGGGGGGASMGSTTTDELSFDRGIWRTDEEGHLTMYDTVPGWYSGRAVHTHVKVYDETSGYQAANGTFVANNTAYHTGQWFWPQDFLALLANVSPYSENTLSYNDSTKNDEDTIGYPYAAANGNQAEMTLTWINSSDITAGVIASTVVGVNLTYSSVETSGSYWTGNITQAEENTTGNTSVSGNSSGSSASSSDTTDGVAKFVSLGCTLFATVIAGAIFALILI